MLYNARLEILKEQDVNARILPSDEYNQLALNIKNRGRLESVPYCAKVDGGIEVVSGHHRVKAARSAGLTHAPILVDESGLSRPEIIATQLAHNRLAGFDDQQTLRLLFDHLDDPALMLETGLSEEMDRPFPEVEWEGSITPHLTFDWKVVTFTFLPHQLKDFEDLFAALPSSDLVGYAERPLFEPFVKAASRYGRLKTMRSIGLIIAALTEIALAEVAKEEGEESQNDGGNGDQNEG